MKEAIEKDPQNILYLKKKFCFNFNYTNFDDSCISFMIIKEMQGNINELKIEGC